MFAGAITSLYCVYNGWGVWTLVAAPIVATIVRALGLTIAARLIVWPSFNFKGAGDIIRYGSAMVIGQFFWIIQSQADVTIAGRLVMPRALGLYAEALFLTQIFAGKFLPPINEVAFPSYSELAKSGGAVGPAFITAARIVMTLTLPLYFGLAVTAEPLVATVFGPKWLDMAPLITILALSMPFWTLQLMFAPATNALGYSSLYVWVNAWGAALLTIGYLIGIRFGIYGLAMSWLVSTPLLLLITAWMSMPKMEASPLALIRGLMPNILAATAMAAIVHYSARLLANAPHGVELMLLIVIGAASYFGLLYSFARAELGEIYALLTQRKLPQ
jgi:O-antigen/teichoic acid export membrane protein